MFRWLMMAKVDSSSVCGVDGAGDGGASTGAGEGSAGAWLVSASASAFVSPGGFVDWAAAPNASPVSTTISHAAELKYRLDGGLSTATVERFSLSSAEGERAGVRGCQRKNASPLQ